MAKQPKRKGATVLLDAEITLALNREQQKMIASLNESGFNGLAMAPSIGALARMMLREALGQKADLTDTQYL